MGRSPIENKKDMFLFDLRTVSFWVFKTAANIADSETFPRDGSLEINYSCSIAMMHERLFPFSWLKS
jgi:hypothetical protein